MSPRSAVKLDTPVTYRVYLSHRLPPGKKDGAVGPICNCRTTWAVQVPRSQQRQALRPALARAASAMIAGHHALPPGTFSVAVDRAVILYRRGRAVTDQDLPGVDIRGGSGSNSISGGGDDDNDNDDDDNNGCWADAEEAVRFWTGHGLAVPVWVEFYARTPPERAHSFITVPGDGGKTAPPKGNEIAVHQALANEEARIFRGRDVSSPSTSCPTVGGSTTSGGCHSSTVSASDDET